MHWQAGVRSSQCSVSHCTHSVSDSDKLLRLSVSGGFKSLEAEQRAGGGKDVPSLVALD